MTAHHQKEDVRIVIEGQVVKTETLSNQHGRVNLVGGC